MRLQEGFVPLFPLFLFFEAGQFASARMKPTHIMFVTILSYKTTDGTAVCPRNTRSTKWQQRRRKQTFYKILQRSLEEVGCV